MAPSKKGRDEYLSSFLSEVKKFVGSGQGAGKAPLLGTQLAVNKCLLGSLVHAEPSRPDLISRNRTQLLTTLGKRAGRKEGRQASKQ